MAKPSRTKRRSQRRAIIVSRPEIAASRVKLSTLVTWGQVLAQLVYLIQYPRQDWNLQPMD